MHKIGDVILFLFLMICSISDLRTRKIPNYILVCMSVVTILCCFCKEHKWEYAVVGAGVGSIFLMISKWTNESVGYGDSWILLLLGIYLGSMKIVELAAIALFLVGIFSLFILVFQKWNRNVAIPFVPFLTVAYIGVIWR